MQYKLLTIAGFDSSGGAGLQADLKTFTAFGCYGMSVLTALPIQNTCGVQRCYNIPTQAIIDQLNVIFDDIIPDAIKIGMLFNEEIIHAIASFIQQRIIKLNKAIPIVLDPVMIAKSGDHLLLPQAINTLKQVLMPLVDIITPNIYEAEQLVGIKINNNEDMLHAGQIFLKLNTKAILIKGGHSNNNYCKDLLITKDLQQWYNQPKIDTINTHGTGCTLSSAIASCLAMGYNLDKSCQIAKNYITHALLSAQNIKLGYGHGPVNHFYHIWPTINLLTDKI